MHALIVQPESRDSYRVPLEHDTIRLGRDRRNQICLDDDPLVSRHHAEIVPEDGAGWFVRDLGSRNGTFVDERKVDDRVRLEHGDRVRVGRTTVVFTDDPDLPTRHYPLWRESASRPPVAVSMSEILSTHSAPSVESIEETGPQSSANTRAFAALGRASDVLLDQRPLEEVLEMALDAVEEVVAPERCAILLLRRARGTKRLEVRASRGLPAGERIVSQTIANVVIDERQSIMTADAQRDERFVASETIGRQHVHAALAVPLWNNKEVIGLVYADATDRHRHFSKADLEALTLLANFVAVKIDNVRLFEQEQRIKLIEAELQNAAAIQRRLLPAAPPRVEGWEFFGFNKPTHDVGGDYYDFVPLAGGKIAMAVGDVSGKGLAGALLMANCQAAFRAHLSSGAAPDRLIARLNDAICENSEDDKFISFFFAKLTPQRARFSYVNAGHAPPLLIRKKGGPKRLMPSGPVLGFLPDRTYRRRKVTMQPGDLLAAFSDGITDAMNEKNEQFGEDRLRELLVQERHRSVDEIWEALRDALTAFVEAEPQFDDLTITLVKRVR